MPQLQTKTSPLHTLLTPPNKTYHVLIQHSHNLQKQRIQSIPTTSQLYERAGITLPHHRAIRNIHGYKVLWNTIYNILREDHVFGILIVCNGDTVVCDGWAVINLCHFFPQENENQNNTYCHPMSDLQQIATTITEILTSKSNTIPILFDSLTPIIHYHGIQTTINFLQIIKQHNILLVTPISIDAILSKNTSKLLEEYSQAILNIYQGQLLLFRKSRRGTGKLMNEVHEFVIEDGSLTFITPSETKEKDGNDDSVEKHDNSLKYEEGQRSAISNVSDDKDVNIFLQDDDPDYEDWDDEDPDDDLDL